MCAAWCTVDLTEQASKARRSALPNLGPDNYQLTFGRLDGEPSWQHSNFRFWPLTEQSPGACTRIAVIHAPPENPQGRARGADHSYKA